MYTKNLIILIIARPSLHLNIVKAFKEINNIQSRKPLELMHIDLVGSIDQQSLGGPIYYITIVNDFSRKVLTTFLKK